jgi:hypothetical protein
MAERLPLVHPYQQSKKQREGEKMKIKTSIKAGDGSAAWGT